MGATRKFRGTTLMDDLEVLGQVTGPHALVKMGPWTFDDVVADVSDEPFQYAGMPEAQSSVLSKGTGLLCPYPGWLVAASMLGRSSVDSATTAQFEIFIGRAVVASVVETVDFGTLMDSSSDAIWTPSSPIAIQALNGTTDPSVRVQDLRTSADFGWANTSSGNDFLAVELWGLFPLVRPTDALVFSDA